ncbi:MAG: WG repeat-containing protein [Flavobacteriia bacterium]|jgi:hypothetical protein
MNKNLFFLLFISVFGVQFGLFAQEEENNPYAKFIAFKSQNKWGFKVESKTVIPAKFDYVTHFSENFALVKENGMWGYIDTLGNWFIEAQFEKGQPIQGGRAFVKKEGKTGLLALDGNEVFKNFLDENGNPKEDGFFEVEHSWKFLIDPLYDNIKEDYNAYYLYSKGKIGYKSKENDDLPVIPCLYDSIYPLYSNLVSGKKSNGKWDVYENGSLILEDIDEAIKYANYDYSASNYVVSVNGKFGIYSLAKKWIVEPKYAFIEKLNFPSYKVDHKNYEMIYALHEKSYQELDPDLINQYSNSDQIELVKANGDKISGIKFNAIKSVYDNYDEIPKPYAIELYADQKLHHLNNDFSIKKFNFTNVIPHYYNNFYISEGGDKTYILDQDLNPIDSFAQVVKYQELSTSNSEMSTFDPETGEEFYSYDPIMTVVEEPFLIAFREKNSKMEKAVYDLSFRKISSSWFPEESNLIVMRNYFTYDQFQVNSQGQILYTYFIEGENRSKMGFCMQNLSEPSALLYEAQSNILVGGYHFVMNKFQGDNLIQELYSINNNKLELISNQYEVINSSEIYVNEPMTEDDYYYGTEELVRKGFQTSFLLLKQNKKYGLISNNGKIYEPQFDTLTQNLGSESIINTISNGKYGIIQLNNDNFIPPSLSQENYFNQYFYTLNKTINFATVYNDNSPYYFLSTNGKKFYSFEGSIFPRKVKKKYGLFVYNQELNEKNALEQVPAQYKFLEQSILPDLFNAQGKNKKWGMINRIGDTIVPIKYSKVEILKVNGDSFFSFKIYDKKKVGVYNFDKGEVIKPSYDDISAFTEQESYIDLFRIKVGDKFGAINSQGQIILKAIYDEINVSYASQEDLYLVATKGNKSSAVSIYAFPSKKDPKEYDLINNGEGYVKVGEEYEVYNLSTEKLDRKIKGGNIVVFGDLYNIILENGKFGATDVMGDVKIPCEYDELSHLDGLGSDVLIGIQNGVKYYIYAESNQRFTEDQW